MIRRHFDQVNAPNLRLKRHFSVVAHSPDVVELRHGTWNPVSFTLRDDSGKGKLLAVLRMLDGSRKPAEIAKAAGVPRHDVMILLDQLEELQLLERGPTHALDYFLDHAIPNFAIHHDDNPAETKAITVLGDGQLVEEVARNLERSNLLTCRVDVDDGRWRSQISRGGVDWVNDGLLFEKKVDEFAPLAEAFVVFAQSTVDPLELRAFNRIALHLGISWIYSATDGPFLLVGPAMIPPRTPCYECLEARILMNLREAASYVSYKKALAECRASRPTVGLDHVLAAIVGSHTAFEAINVLLTGTGFTVGKMLAFYLPTMEVTFNEVLRVASCPACGSTEERDERELYFDIRTMLSNEDDPRAQ